MDVKKEAARLGATLIVDQKNIGLGEGSTIAFLVAEINRQTPVPGRTFYTSSEKTKKLLGNAGFDTGSLSQTSAIDIYFDGCDQVDYSLNALKSGAGIHTMEKLLASMAAEFVILADQTKYVPAFDGKYPLVVELIPEALSFILSRILKWVPGVRLNPRQIDQKFATTPHGNLLLDVWLPDWSTGDSIALAIKNEPGVLETSLFSGIAKKAVIASEVGTRIVEPANHSQS